MPTLVVLHFVQDFVVSEETPSTEHIAGMALCHWSRSHPSRMASVVGKTAGKEEDLADLMTSCKFSSGIGMASLTSLSVGLIKHYSQNFAAVFKRRV